MEGCSQQGDRIAMTFPGIMTFQPNKTVACGFDFAGCERDIEQMQRVVEVIGDEAKLHSWHDLKGRLDTIFNGLEQALIECRKSCDTHDREEQARIEDEMAEAEAEAEGSEDE